ncbi:MAG: SDR family NAD(P)-dependent oxidoreductase [Candidatus Microthrix subdominans]
MSAPTNHLEGRTIIVTGAASGFGRLLAEKTAALGANVGACDIDADALADLAALAPDQIADQAIHAINQPWGVSIADITIRASNDDYIV